MYERISKRISWMTDYHSLVRRTLNIFKRRVPETIDNIYGETMNRNNTITRHAHIAQRLLSVFVGDDHK